MATTSQSLTEAEWSQLIEAVEELVELGDREWVVIIDLTPQQTIDALTSVRTKVRAAFGHSPWY